MIKSIQGMRSVAMITIFLWHSRLISNGSWPVTFFFIISGFLTYLSRNKNKDNINGIRNSIKFSFNKIKNMYLLHIITLIISIPMRYKFLIAEPVKAIQAILAHIMLIQSIVPDNSIYFNFNESSWYLSSILFVYIFTSLFMKIISISEKKIKSIFLLVIVFVFQLIIAISIKDSNIVQWALYINPLFRSLDYFMGMILADIYLTNMSKNNNYVSKLEIISTAILLFSIIINSEIPKFLVYGTYFTPFILFFIYSISFERGIVSKILSNEILLKLSKISFEFFMIHMPVIILISKTCEILNISNSIATLLSFLITIILSIIYKKTYTKLKIKNKVTG